MSELDNFIERVEDRYSRALDAKPSKGPITDVDALVDSVCDVPELIKIIQMQQSNYDWLLTSVTTITDNLEDRYRGDITL